MENGVFGYFYFWKFKWKHTNFESILKLITIILSKFKILKLHKNMHFMWIGKYLEFITAVFDINK